MTLHLPHRRGAMPLIAGLVVLTLVPLALFAYFAVSLATDAVSREATGRVSSAAEVSAEVVGGELTALRDIVASYAARPNLVEVVADGAAGERERVVFHLAELAQAREGISLAFLSDERGRLVEVIPRTPSVVGKNFAFRDWYRGVTTTGRPYVSEAYVTAATGNATVVAAAAPIRDASNRDLGILVAGYDLEFIQAFVDRFEASEGVDLTVTDQRGVLLAAPGGTRPGLVSVAGNPEVAAALRGEHGAAERDGARGRELAAWQPVAGLGWTVTATVPREHVLARVDELRATVLSIAAVLAVVLLGGIAFLARLLWQRDRSDALTRRSQQEAEEARKTLAARNEELEAASSELEHQNTELELQTAELEDQQLLLATANEELGERQAELERAVAELALEKERIETLYAFGQLIAGETHNRAHSAVVLRELADVAGADVAVLYTIVAEEDEGPVRLNSALGLDESRLPDTVVPGHGLAGRSLAELRPIATGYGEAGLTVPGLGGEATVTHELHVPLVIDAAPVGLVQLGRLGDRPFTPEELETIEHLGRQTAVRVANRVAYDRARRLAAINRAVLDATPDAIVLVDLEGRRLVENAAAQQLTGESDGRANVYEGLGRSAGRIREPEAFLAVMEASRADPEFQDVLTIEVAESGQAFLLYTAPVRDDAGAPTGRIFVLRDVTHEHEAGRLKSELLATVSHELRTPLASILGFSELMVSRELDADRTQRYVRTIHSEARRLTKLIDDFLDLQRIEAGCFTVDLQPFDLAALLEQQADVFIGQSPEHQLVLSLPEHSPQVLGEPERIAQVVANLVSNAIKYSPKGGPVEVAADARDGHIRVSVRDYGLGIPHDQQRLIFTKFFRVDSSDTRSIGGTGLGLALAREIVEAHGGTIGFESAEGSGSTFWFELPAGRAAVGGPRRALVVEDDPAAAELLRTLLEAEGLEVEVARTGEEAVARATAEPPALVCLDLELAGELDGWDVLTRLKEDAATDRVPVLICTGGSGRDRARALGASDFLVKPFSAEALAGAVARVLGHDGGSVLVVDDDASVRRLVVESLATLDVEVHEAADGEEALRAVSRLEPDAIVLDLGLPGLDGFDVLERLRAGEASRRIPVIVLTARRLSADERAALSKRAVSLLEKSSYSAVELREAVRRALGVAPRQLLRSPTFTR